MMTRNGFVACLFLLSVYSLPWEVSAAKNAEAVDKVDGHSPGAVVAEDPISVQGGETADHAMGIDDGAATDSSLEALKAKIREQLAANAGVNELRKIVDEGPRARLSAYAPPSHAAAHRSAIVGDTTNGVGHVLDEAAIKEHKEDFSYFDLNQDGFVDAEEMRVVFVEMGDVASLQEMMQFYEDVDQDNTGTISWEEYVQYAMLTG